MEKVHTSKAPEAIGPYSQAIKSGSFVFLSGQIPLVPETGELLDGDIKAQANQALTNLRHVLEAAGSSMDRIVRATVYVADMADFADVNQVYAEFITHKPARVTIEASGLPKGARIEVDAIAEIDG